MVLTRLEELEESLFQRCMRREVGSDDASLLDKFAGLGVPEEEMRAWRCSD